MFFSPSASIMIILVSCFQGYLIHCLAESIFNGCSLGYFPYIYCFLLIFPVSSYSVNISLSLISQNAITFSITMVLLVSHKNMDHTYCRNANSYPFILIINNRSSEIKMYNYLHLQFVFFKSLFRVPLVSHCSM